MIRSGGETGDETLSSSNRGMGASKVSLSTGTYPDGRAYNKREVERIGPWEN